jgi:peptide/nickel transport system permease protein
MYWSALRRNKPGLVGAGLLTALTLIALFGEWLAPYDATKLTGRPFERPSATHLLGTNDIGQDILSELLVGARVSLLIGVLAAVIALLIGTFAGVIAGYYRGLPDTVLMRLVDVALVVPFVPLMVLLAAYLGQSLWNLIVVIGLLIWARPARVIRAYVLSLAERDYVLAARAIGARNGHIVLRHVLPGVLSLALAQFVLAASASMLLEASLSFLGLGDPTQKSWGTMLFYAQARSAFLSGAWLWWVVPPGLMITAAVLGFALLGLALEDALNPNVRRHTATSADDAERTRRPVRVQGNAVGAPSSEKQGG